MIINFLNRFFIKSRIWQVLLSIVIFSAIIVSCTTSLPSTSSSDQSNLVTSSSSSTSVAKVSVVAVEVETLPTRTSYTPVDVVTTQGGVLRVIYSDYTIRYIPMNDAMIDLGRFNISTVGINQITLKYQELDQVYYVTYNINIVPFVVGLEKVSLDIENTQVIQGQSFKINLVIEPLNAYVGRVVWSSSNPLVASVDQQGIVDAINVGKTIISVDVDGKFISMSSIEVNAKILVESPINPTPPNPGIVELSIQDYLDLGYIPISTPAELNQIRVGTTSFIASYNDQTYTFSADYADLTNALKRKYILTNSIDLGMAPYNSTTGWLPIGDNNNRFVGEFIGYSNRIENLFINRPDSDFIGLFGIFGAGTISDVATIKNLEIEIKQINGRSYVGGLAGIIDPGALIDKVDIISESVNSKITGLQLVGGLVGVHGTESSSFNSTPFVFTLGEDGKYHYSNEIGNILPNNLESEDYAVLDYNQLALQSDGKYYINITNEYNEIAYLDEINLVVFEHESNQEIALSSLRSDIGSINSMAKIIPTNTLPILNAINSKGNNVTDYLITRDANWTNFEKEENDYFEYFELNLGNLRNSNNINLVYSSVRDYLLISPNRFVFDVYVGNDSWLPVAEFDAKLASSNIKRPISFPRLNILDLTQVYNGVGRPSEFIIRFGFNRVSYDYFGIAVDISDEPLSYSTLNPSSVDLSYRGFSVYDQTFPYKNFDYQNLKTQTHGYYLNQSGYFTKFGDVTPLLENKDDQFAILRYGDELKFSFEAQPVSNGLVRSYILEGAVWYKHADRVSGTTVEPIPFNGMSTYPHSDNLIDPNYQLEWNTRYYAPTLNLRNTIKYSSTDIIVEGSRAVGGLVGVNHSGTIENSTSSGNVFAVDDEDNVPPYNIGGLVGVNRNGKILNSSSSGDVSAPNFYWVGGLIGQSYNDSFNVINKIVNSYSSGDVIGNSRVGGLVGFLRRSVVEGSNSSSIVTATNNYAGGLVGRAVYSEISNSFATGSVAGVYYVGGFSGEIFDTDLSNVFATGTVVGIYFVGGLIGDVNPSVDNDSNIFNSNITNSYAINNVQGREYVGGLIGRINESSITNSYSNSNITVEGTQISTGRFVGLAPSQTTIVSSYFNIASTFNGGTANVTFNIDFGKTLTELRNKASPIYQDWDFIDVWDISSDININNGLPYLAWQIIG